MLAAKSNPGRLASHFSPTLLLLFDRYFCRDLLVDDYFGLSTFPGAEKPPIRQKFPGAGAQMLTNVTPTQHCILTDRGALLSLAEAGH